MSADKKIKSEERYVSFRGIDCEGNATKVMEHVFAIISDPEKTNPFWEKFKLRVTDAAKLHARIADELCLLCSHTYYIEDLFEEHGDETGLFHLRRLEDECC